MAVFQSEEHETGPSSEVKEEAGELQACTADFVDRLVSYVVKAKELDRVSIDIDQVRLD
jgi:hypothetical protein